MLAKILGLLLLAAGAIVALGVLGMLIGTAIGLVWLAIKLAIPLLLIYVGYRLVTRDRRSVAY
jgi:hypothetical protein